jgi:hypothetical protein
MSWEYREPAVEQKRNHERDEKSSARDKQCPRPMAQTG